ncbi:hypothetical protein HanIR_Chr09g0419791 [Helianthus annuus]|nr:hypothetical protein HanIR_Chr09g0419791 [Helianthus annuus]
METKKVMYVDNSVVDSSVTDWNLNVEKKKQSSVVKAAERVFLFSIRKDPLKKTWKSNAVKCT